MKQLYRLNAVAALFALGGVACAADEGSAPIDTVVVSGTRVGHTIFDMPAAIDVVDGQRIGEAQARVNASEALSAVPGLVAQNRQNYAQDLQISSRGFGARSAFGVRGVRLIADGIPASMPDGQGQAATFNLDLADRIEVLRGPFSVIYGNHSGGVIQLFTRDGEGAPTIESTLTTGSYGSHKLDVNAQGQQGSVGYVLDASHFETDGYRAHSAARRDQAAAKLTLRPLDNAVLNIVANGLHQGDTQDALGVTWATYQRDPRAGEIDTSDTQTPKRTLADRYNTRKSIDHQQIGANWEQQFGEDRLHLSTYGGNRQVVQYQAFSKALQAPASNSGGVVDFDRNFYGADLNWLHVSHLADGILSTTAGLEYSHSGDDRRGYENFIGTQYGVKGALRRSEDDNVSSTEPYLQTEWQSGAWMLSAGLRHSSVRISVDDHYLANGNDSGSLSYSHTTPVAGVLYKFTPELHAYASAARGFETPTLNELFYSGTGAGFNFRLQPAHSKHLEAGIKLRSGDNTRINAAVFQIRTNDELVVDSSSGGRTSYRNAGRTLRQGVELALDTSWRYGFSSHVALTSLRAIYDEGFGTVLKGSRLPGVPNANGYADLAWKDSTGLFSAAVEATASSRIYADDANADQPAPGYAVLNARIGSSQRWHGWQFKQFVRLNNLLDRQYVGSVIVGDSNKRYYEAAPTRNWLLGASAQYQF